MSFSITSSSTQITTTILSSFDVPSFSFVPFGYFSSKPEFFCGLIKSFVGDFNALKFDFPSFNELDLMSCTCTCDLNKYTDNIAIARRFIKTMDQINNIGFKTNFFDYTKKSNTVHEFLEYVIDIFDSISSRFYLPLSKEMIKSLGLNAFANLFSCKRLNETMHWTHIYEIERDKNYFQEKLLDGLPYLDGPELICFDDRNDLNVSFKDLPMSLVLPIGVTRDTLDKVCERCYSWNNYNIEYSQKVKVLNAYKNVIKFEKYVLFGVIGESNGKYLAFIHDNYNKDVIEKIDIDICCSLYCKESHFKN